MERSSWKPGGSITIMAAVLVSAVALYFFYTRSGRTESMSTAADASPLATSEALRTQADRLYERAITELASGDTTEAQVIAPIALRAYQDAGDLDADGMYHAVILLTAMKAYGQAREAADQVLAEIPGDLLVLAAAARAARLEADTAAARSYYDRFLAAYDRQRLPDASPDPHGHRVSLPESKAQAEAFTRALGRTAGAQ